MVFNDNLSEDDRGKLRVLLIHKTLNPFVGQDWKVTLSFFLPGCYQKPFLLLELLLSLLGFGSIVFPRILCHFSNKIFEQNDRHRRCLSI